PQGRLLPHQRPRPRASPRINHRRMNTKGVNFQPSKRGQFSTAVDTESYAPERDFYGPMRRALLDGVVNGDDVRRTHEVCQSCSEKKREHYRALADGWQRWRKGRALFGNPRGEDWFLQGLAVRVAPPIIVRSKNRRDLVWLY